MTPIVFAFAISIAALLLAALSLGLAIFNFIEQQAMKRATHTIQYVPADDLGSPVGDQDLEGFQSLTEEQKKKMGQDPLEAL